MNNIWFYLVFLVSVFVSAVSQTLLKKAAMKTYRSFIKQYINPLVVCAYGLFFLSTVVNVIAYRYIPLSVGMVLETTSYLYIMLFGVVMFREKLNLRRVVAIICIISGIVVCALLG